MGVEGLATGYASKWGVNTEKATLAALLHDLLKAESKSSLRKTLEAQTDFALDAEDFDHPQAWHGMAAAVVGRRDLGIADAEVLEAAAWHTTGTPGLGDVGLVLYIADFLEPTRSFEGVEALRRELLALPPRKAALRVSEAKFESLRMEGKKPHGRTIRLRDWLTETTT